MVSTESPDPDSAMLARIRAEAGPGAAIVATLDLHANISERMVDSADVISGGGITAVVIGARHQTADPVFFEALGLDIGAARTVCVKSRGHFRAGFDLWFAPDRVFEIDTPGVTAPVLDRFAWKALPRPVYPLDPDTVWTPPSDPA